MNTKPCCDDPTPAVHRGQPYCQSCDADLTEPGTYAGEYLSAIARAKKILTAAGFPWSRSTGRYSAFGGTKKTTDGVRVVRVGCSETVCLHVYQRYDYSPTHREEYRWIDALAIATLRDAGMSFDDRGWLACGSDVRRAAARRGTP